MGAEIGATTSVFPYNHRMKKYLSKTGRTGEPAGPGWWGRAGLLNPVSLDWLRALKSPLKVYERYVFCSWLSLVLISFLTGLASKIGIA